MPCVRAEPSPASCTPAPVTGRAARRALLPALAVVALGASFAAGAAETRIQCAKDDPNLKAYLAMTDLMFVPRDASVAARFYAPEFISHNNDAGGGSATKMTPERFKEVYEGSKRTYGERGFRNDLILCAGPFLVARVIMTSKMTGPMGSQAATGKTATTSAIDIYRFENGKVVERWGNNDGIGTLWQLGLPLPPAPPAAPAGAPAKK